MSQADHQLARHTQVLMGLAKSKSWGSGDLETSLRQVTEAAANTMEIARVNVWLFDEERTKIRCLDHYDRASGEHSSGVEIGAAEYPVYFQALDEERAIVADDAHTDPRTSEFSKGYLDVHGITSMLDAPLHSEGRVIGIVCHEHVGPARKWTSEEQQFAASLADLAALAVESYERLQAEEALRRANAELEERVQKRTAELKQAVAEKERLLSALQTSSFELLGRLRELEHKSDTIRHDLERAQMIQRALLPAHPPELEGVRVDALYRPGMNVGGDLYDVVHLEGDRIALFVADAAGHGVCAAMLSVLFKQRLQLTDESGQALAPAEVLRRVNMRVSEDVLTDGLFLTVGYVLLHTKTGEMRAASAGHTPMVVRRSDGQHVLLERTGPALGVDPAAEFGEHELTVARGDRLMLFTDGLLDGLESAGAEGIGEILARAMNGGMESSPERLHELYREAVRRAEEVVDGEGSDDVTLLMLEVADGPSSFDNGSSEEGSGEEGVSAAPPKESEAEVLWLGESEGATTLAVRGRGTWTSSDAFRRLARHALDEGRRLNVDLGQCTYLDSAFLGTLHEVVAHGPEGRTTVGHPRDCVLALFDELGLDQVRASVLEDPPEPACELTPVAQDAPTRAIQLRLLRAHEVLSELSEENRERFAGVVHALRSELADGGH